MTSASRPVLLPLDPAPAPVDGLAALADLPHPFLLESARLDPGFGRWSFLGADPADLLSGGAEAFAELGPRLAARRVDAAGPPAPFSSGAVGFFSYDLGRAFERIPSRAEDDLRLPWVHLAFHDAVACFDHETGRAFVAGRPGAEAAARRLHARLAAAPAGRAELPRLASVLRSTFTPAEYVDAVLKVKDYIEAGDCFQVNLSQRYECETEETGAAIYRRLRRSNPAPYAAYLTAPGGAEVLSASPERFLKVAGDAVVATPIKGTRPRGRDAEEDRALLADLLSSEKDRAELVMIVDLIRNDLGRVARFGSVEVPELFAVTSHATVHHLHGTVTARLAEGRGIPDLLRATFPCGSITGAPKVRSMEIIEELEPVRRGVYTGAIGWISDAGDAEFSVAIRTMTVQEGRAVFSVGGGIVADSDPLAEYEETKAKGRGLAAALGYRL